MTKLKRNVISIIGGAACGIVNGLFGGGGGMLVIPILTLLEGFPEKVAHATAIAVVLPITLASGASYALFKSLEWRPALFVTAGVVAGGIIGSLLLKALKAKWISKVFAAVVFAAGVKMLFF